MFDVGTFCLYSISGGSIGVPGCVDCLGYVLCLIGSLSDGLVGVRMSCEVVVAPYSCTYVTLVERGLT